MHPNVHCNIVYNNQNMETTYMSINRGMDREDVVHMYIMEYYYSAIKRNEIGSFVEIWIDCHTG